MLIPDENQKADFFSLHITGENGLLKKIPLEDSLTVLGNVSERDIFLPHELTLSFKLKNNPDGYYLEKIDGPEDFLLNDNPLTSPALLTPGDIVSFDKIRIQFIHESPSQEQDIAPGDEGKTQFMQVVSIESNPSKGRLVGVSGSIKGRIFELTKEKISVGRDSSNDICIQSDGLSRAHAMIEIGPDSITIIDFNSTNGTFINGKKITTETIKPGTTIQFANAALSYEIPSSGNTTYAKSHFMSTKNVLIFVIICGTLFGGFFYYTQKQKKDLEAQKIKLEHIVKEQAEDSPKKDLELAERAFRNREYDAALKIILSCLEKYPNHPQAILIQERVVKAQKKEELKINYNKAIKYYHANEFEKAKNIFSCIDADFEEYESVKQYIGILNKVDIVEEAYTQAVNDFNSGNLEKTRESLNFILNQIPVFKPALELQKRAEEIGTLLKEIQISEAENNLEKLEKCFEKVLSLISDDRNYFYTLAKNRLKELKTGNQLQAEKFYVKGIEALAQRKYVLAQENLEKAYQLAPDVIKIKIAYTESTQKREKLIESVYQAALLMEKENAPKAKLIWKKIIEMGNHSNPYYETAIKKLES